VTIYRIYEQNGHRAGFWVQHRSWKDSCAQVQSIAGQKEGRLAGSPQPEDSDCVLMRVFDVRSGRMLDGDKSQHPASDKNFAQIAEPFWHSARRAH
jgi:hypothetical protein